MPLCFAWLTSSVLHLPKLWSLHVRSLNSRVCMSVSYIQLWSLHVSVSKLQSLHVGVLHSTLESACRCLAFNSGVCMSVSYIQLWSLHVCLFDPCYYDTTSCVLWNRMYSFLWVRSRQVKWHTIPQCARCRESTKLKCSPQIFWSQRHWHHWKAIVGYNYPTPS